VLDKYDSLSYNGNTINTALNIFNGKNWFCYVSIGLHKCKAGLRYSLSRVAAEGRRGLLPRDEADYSLPLEGKGDHPQDGG